jgi:hypothetical protein
VVDRPWILAVRRRSARVLLFFAAMVGLPTCILPPDDPVVEMTYRPLAVDLESVVPTLPVQDVFEGCAPFTVGATRVFNPAARPLQARWVADNRQQGLVKVIVFSPEPISAEPLIVEERISATDFKTSQNGDVPHSLSLFITDADDWAVPNGTIDEAIDSGRVTDAGLIRTSSVVDGLPNQSVVEIRWVFRFTTTTLGKCPPT